MLGIFSKTPIGEEMRFYLSTAAFFILAASGSAGVLDRKALENARYEGNFLWSGAKSIQLVTGKKERNLKADDHLACALQDARFGDLNGDGRPEAVAFLRCSGGGSGSSLHMHVMGERAGKAVQLASLASWGDRVGVEDVSLESSSIELSLLTHGPRDPLCCPTWKKKEIYRLENGALLRKASFYVWACPASSSSFRRVGLFDGPPEERASLVPDDPSAKRAAWTLTGAVKGFWLGCYYEGSDAPLAVALPKEVKRCAESMARPLGGVECEFLGD